MCVCVWGGRSALPQLSLPQPYLAELSRGMDGKNAQPGCCAVHGAAPVSACLDAQIVPVPGPGVDSDDQQQHRPSKAGGSGQHSGGLPGAVRTGTLQPQTCMLAVEDQPYTTKIEI